MDFSHQQSHLSTIFNVFLEENHQIKSLDNEMLISEHQYLQHFIEKLISILPLGKVEEAVIQEQASTLHLFIQDQKLHGYNTDKLFLRK
jgi:hypothetical protein